jgi:benzodiazapine receptor
MGSMSLKGNFLTARFGGGEASSSKTRAVLALAASVAGSFIPAAIGGLGTSRSVNTWYQPLRKPAFTPPGEVIGTVWTTLYTLLGVSAWLVWRQADQGAAAKQDVRSARGWYLAQLGFNAAWPWAFFGLHSPLAGLVAIVPLWVSVFGWVRAAWRVRALAGLLQLPYLAWASFASVLNASIWWLNR